MTEETKRKTQEFLKTSGKGAVKRQNYYYSQKINTERGVYSLHNKIRLY